MKSSAPDFNKSIASLEAFRQQTTTVFFRNSNIGRINFRFNGCDIFAISTKNESYVLRSVFNYRKFIWSIALSNG